MKSFVKAVGVVQLLLAGLFLISSASDIQLGFGFLFFTLGLINVVRG